jgi:hypothetical protein
VFETLLDGLRREPEMSAEFFLRRQRLYQPAFLARGLAAR